MRRAPAPLAAVALIALLLLAPAPSFEIRDETLRELRGTTTAAEADGRVAVRLEDGSAAEIGVFLSSEVAPAPPLRAGEAVIISRSLRTDGSSEMAVIERDRGALLAVVAAIVALVAMVIGRGRGLRATLAMAASTIFLLRYLLPALIAGAPAIPVSVGGALLIAGGSLLLVEGFGRSTVAAVSGIAIGLFVAMFAVAVTGAAGGFSAAWGQEDLILVTGLFRTPIDIGGIALAGALIAAVGVIDDAALTQAVAVEEIAAADRSSSRGQIFTRAMSIGGAHSAAILNTLLITYAGLALPIVAVAASSGSDLGMILSTEQLAGEVLRALAGSIGVLVAIPASTAIAAFLVERR
jgi:uncharacterized membrane protein